MDERVGAEREGKGETGWTGRIAKVDPGKQGIGKESVWESINTAITGVTRLPGYSLVSFFLSRVFDLAFEQ